MTTQMLFRNYKQKFAEKRFSAFRIIRSFATVQTAKSILRAAGLGAGLDGCLFEEYQYVAQLHFSTVRLDGAKTNNPRQYKP
jgi:hypothetical protein